MKKTGSMFLALITVLLSPMTANADLIAFDTFGPGDSFSSSTFGVDGNAQFQAFQFVAEASGSLSEISVALGRRSELTTATTFQLYTDAGDSLGVLLESIDIANNVAPSPSSPFSGEVVTFSSIVNSMLNFGDKYWLSYSEPNVFDGSSSLWFFNDQGISGLRDTSDLNVMQNLLPAFRVSVSVPEPGTLGLIGIGLAAMGLTRRKKRAV